MHKTPKVQVSNPEISGMPNEQMIANKIITTNYSYATNY